MALTLRQCADLVASVVDDLGRLKWTSISAPYQKYYALPQLLKKKKVKIRGGTQIQRNVRVATTGAARNVGPWEPDAYNQASIMQKITVPFRHTTTNYMFNKAEINANRHDENEIFDLVKTRREAALEDLANLMENDFWSKPADSTDDIKPFGIKYWVVANSTQGFNGGAPAGFAAGAGNLLHNNWKNWTDEYVAVTPTDFKRKLKKAMRRTNFKPPMPTRDYNRGNQWEVFCKESSIDEVEMMGEQQNQNLGNDLDKYGDSMVIRGASFQWVPALDGDTTDPFIGINWGVFRPFFQDGDYMAEDPPRRAPWSHRVMLIDIDTTWNTVCEDRRALFTLNRAAA